VTVNEPDVQWVTSRDPTAMNNDSVQVTRQGSARHAYARARARTHAHTHTHTHTPALTLACMQVDPRHPSWINASVTQGDLLRVFGRSLAWYSSGGVWECMSGKQLSPSPTTRCVHERIRLASHAKQPYFSCLVAHLLAHPRICVIKLTRGHTSFPLHILNEEEGVTCWAFSFVCVHLPMWSACKVGLHLLVQS
jgi:hypothetical protein